MVGEGEFIDKGFAGAERLLVNPRLKIETWGTRTRDFLL